MGYKNCSYLIRRLVLYPIELQAQEILIPHNIAGGEGGIRTHGRALTLQSPSKRSRYGHFGTSPKFYQSSLSVTYLLSRNSFLYSGGGEIRTHVSLTAQPLFESGPLRPLRYPSHLAEERGFEPLRHLTAPNCFQDSPVQPLRHSSKRSLLKKRAA